MTETRLARAISYLCHPLFIPLYMLILLFNLPGFPVPVLPLRPQLYLAALVVLTTVVLPLTLTWFLRRLGLVGSITMERREERAFPILTTALFYYLTYYLLKGIHPSALFSFYMLGATLLGIVSMLVNFFRKISLHMEAAGSVTGLFLGLSLNFGINLQTAVMASVLIAGVIGYARMKMETHRPAEIYSGYLTGAVVMTLLMLLP